MDSTFSIQEIIDGCRAEQPVYQRALVNQYSDRLYAIAVRYLRDRELSKDVLQESLIRIFKYFDTYDTSKASLTTWMTRITIRQCLSRIEKKEVQLVSMDAASYKEASLDTTALDELQNQDLVKLIQELPDGYKEVFNLSVDGFSHSEIAELLGVNVGASRSRLWRAKEILKKKIIAIENLEQWADIS